MNSTCAYCTLEPPPDILHIPPPPFPAILQQGSDFYSSSDILTFPPHLNDSPCKHFCDRRSEGVQYIEMPQQGRWGSDKLTFLGMKKYQREQRVHARSEINISLLRFVFRNRVRRHVAPGSDNVVHQRHYHRYIARDVAFEMQVVSNISLKETACVSTTVKKKNNNNKSTYKKKSILRQFLKKIM